MKIECVSGLLFFVTILPACRQTASDHYNSFESNNISGYTHPTETFKVVKGCALFDTLPGNLNTCRVVPGNGIVFIYKRSGVTVVDENDWEAKYFETLIFQVDTTVKNYNYHNNDLQKLKCKYFWICLSKEIQKEVRNVDSGFIGDTLVGDSVQIMIDVNPGFTFGGTTEKDNYREIKYYFNKKLALYREYSN